MMKILNFIIILMTVLFFTSYSLGEVKKDCSQYSTKTLSGLSDKMRCKKGLPPLKKNFFKSLQLKNKNSEIDSPKKKIACGEHSAKTLSGLFGIIKCKRSK